MASWAIQARALVGTLGPCGHTLGPCGAPWALVGSLAFVGRALVDRALVGPLGPYGPPGLLWAGLLWAPRALVGRALVRPRGPCGPGPCGPALVSPPGLSWALNIKGG